MKKSHTKCDDPSAKEHIKEMERQKFKEHVKAWELEQKRIKAAKNSGQSKGKAEETVRKNKKIIPA